MTERANIFAEAAQFESPDLDDFDARPAPPPVDTEALQQAAKKAGFESREPKSQSRAAPKPQARATVPAPSPEPAPRKDRRYRTGRNIQFTTKVSAEYQARVDRIIDEHGWMVAETFEKMVEALERELGITPQRP